MVDQKEAPDGYYPVPRSAVINRHEDHSNICTRCDWRPDCDKKICSCMSYDRADGIGVVFKRKETL